MAKTTQEDMITWFMDLVPDEEQNPFFLSRRLLSANFGAMHTTSLVRLYQHFVKM